MNARSAIDFPIPVAIAMLGLCAQSMTAEAQDRFEQPPASPPPGQPAYPPAQDYLPQDYPPPQTHPSRPGDPPRPAMQPSGPADGIGAAVPQHLAAVERQDYGVASSRRLHDGAMHGPTPASVPGGTVITTAELVGLLREPGSGILVFDVLGADEALPGAISTAFAYQPGSFGDAVQRQLDQHLQQASGGRRDLPMVFYCMSTYCWMSYNAALRAINLGYTNVLWYRGGLDAWKQAGQPVQQGFAGRW